VVAANGVSFLGCICNHFSSSEVLANVTSTNVSVTLVTRELSQQTDQPITLHHLDQFWNSSPKRTNFAQTVPFAFLPVSLPIIQECHLSSAHIQDLIPPAYRSRSATVLYSLGGMGRDNAKRCRRTASISPTSCRGVVAFLPRGGLGEKGSFHPACAMKVGSASQRGPRATVITWRSSRLANSSLYVEAAREFTGGI
jgi:hypothetical protein